MPPLYRQAPSLSRCSMLEQVYLAQFGREAAAAICVTFRRKPALSIDPRDVPMDRRSQAPTSAANPVVAVATPGSGLPSSEPAAN